MRSTFGAGLTQCGVEGMRFVEVQWLGGAAAVVRSSGWDLERLGGEKVGRWEGEEIGELDAGEVRT